MTQLPPKPGLYQNWAFPESRVPPILELLAKLITLWQAWRNCQGEWYFPKWCFQEEIYNTYNDLRKHRILELIFSQCSFFLQMKNPVSKEVRPQYHRSLEQASYTAQNLFCLTHHQGKDPLTLEGWDHPSQAKLVAKGPLCFLSQFPTPGLLISPVILSRYCARCHFQHFTGSIFSEEERRDIWGSLQSSPWCCSPGQHLSWVLLWTDTRPCGVQMTCSDLSQSL